MSEASAPARRGHAAARGLGGRARLRRWLLLFAAALVGSARPAPATDRGGAWCLPPVFDGGERLHGLPGPTVFWLELLLRQHEVCWRDVPGEVRIFLAGSSSVFGFPFPADKTFAHQLNASFAASHLPAHVFNLAFVNPYQVRDAVILNEARRFRPDVILYPVTRAEFRHVAPVFFPPVAAFFNSNRSAVTRLAADPPAGLDEPIRKYDRILHGRGANTSPLDYLREAGRFVRTGARLHARSVARAAGAALPPLARQAPHRQTTYDCAETHRTAARVFANWQDWNILEYLDELRRGDGVDVVLVSWPIAHEPVDDCYNVRDTEADVAEFAAWMRDQATARNLPYVDLQKLLPSELFLDSLHVSAEGHARIARELTAALRPIIEQRLQRCAQTGTGCGQ